MTIRTTYPTFQEAMRAIATQWNAAFSGTRMLRGVDTVDDVISTKGLVLQSPNLHYWRISVSDTGVISATDLGTTKP